MDAITELEWLRRMEKARRQQMDAGYRARTPGYSEYASGALGDVATVETLSNTGFPIVSDAADAALATDAARRGKWGEAALYGTALALPFVAGPALKTGFDVIGRKLGKVGDVPYAPSAVEAAAYGNALPGRGQVDIFAGANAKTADRVALERAQQMASQGVDAGKIWEDTGWWVPTEGGPIPPGGAPRFEIPDPPLDTPVKRVTPMGEKAAADYAHRANVLESAAWLKDFAAQNKLDIPETLKQMKELGFEMPSSEAIKQAMMLQQSPGTMMARAHTYKQLAEREAMGPGTLAERYPHPELYEAYPQLKNYRVELVDADRIGGARGEFDPVQKKIRIDRGLSDEEIASTLLHEAQHGVQDIEPDFSPGGNTSAALERMGEAMDLPNRLQLLERIRGSMKRVLQEEGLTEAERLRVMKDLQETEAKIAQLRPKVPTPETKNTWGKMNDFERYRHLGGEAEARLVQNRQGMREPGRMSLAAKVAPYLTPEQKRQFYPWTKVGGLDVPLEYIIP